MDSDTVVLSDAAATQALGRRIAERWLQHPPQPAAAVLLLRGDLGAGKTCLVQGLAQGLAIAEPITSPTFALAQHYQGGRGNLVHLDLYRLEHSAAADDLLAQEEEAAQELGALLAVEWPERLSFVPHGCWQLQLELLDPADPAAGRRALLQLPR
ncbi:MAG: tRNA (adenosine(37)-N6)-threonylcarbamoyltransferase complex ATPase subunit type 1 TsaE [Cyanobacteriota bacterium]|nr:tRNA (adenosine(37)-N6)-threonylcarbamoyltransferase complex ATPase subunit type 1 TsaE [Cyanobacteriota bacterium]